MFIESKLFELLDFEEDDTHIKRLFHKSFEYFRKLPFGFSDEPNQTDY